MLHINKHFYRHDKTWLTAKSKQFGTNAKCHAGDEVLKDGLGIVLA